jgi:Holliday junction resolvase
LNRRFAAPPHWSTDGLEKKRRQATADFIKERLAEGASRYEPILDECVRQVRLLFDRTDNLRYLGSGSSLASEPELVTPARYLGGPPISADDLDVLAEMRVANRRRLDPRLARTAASVIEAALDRRRFPWLFERPPRDPTPEERTHALEWTAGLWAAQRVATGRRGESSSRQEAQVEKVLLEAGFNLVRGAGEIDVTGEALAGGEFSREILVIGTKCDVPVKLRDGRLLLIECKVSNSSLNSVKRLIRETCGKARAWRDGFGARAITAVVLAGVFKLRHLEEAQDRHSVALFWERDLAPLRRFVAEAAP